MVTSCPVVGSVATTVVSLAEPAVAADGAETAGAAADGVDALEPIAFATSNGVTKPTLEVVPIMDSFRPPFNPVSKDVSPVTAYSPPIPVAAPWAPSVPALFPDSLPTLLAISAVIWVAVLPSKFAVSDR